MEYYFKASIYKAFYECYREIIKVRNMVLPVFYICEKNNWEEKINVIAREKEKLYLFPI